MTLRRTQRDPGRTSNGELLPHPYYPFSGKFEGVADDAVVEISLTNTRQMIGLTGLILTLSAAVANFKATLFDLNPTADGFDEGKNIVAQFTGAGQTVVQNFLNSPSVFESEKLWMKIEQDTGGDIDVAYRISCLDLG